MGRHARDDDAERPVPGRNQQSGRYVRPAIEPPPRHGPRPGRHAKRRLRWWIAVLTLAVVFVGLTAYLHLPRQLPGRDGSDALATEQPLRTSGTLCRELGALPRGMALVAEPSSAGRVSVRSTDVEELRIDAERKTYERALCPPGQRPAPRSCRVRAPIEPAGVGALPARFPVYERFAWQGRGYVVTPTGRSGQLPESALGDCTSPPPSAPREGTATIRCDLYGEVRDGTQVGVARIPAGAEVGLEPDREGLGEPVGPVLVVVALGAPVDVDGRPRRGLNVITTPDALQRAAACS